MRALGRVYSQVARESSRPKLLEILVMSPEKKNQVAQRNKYRKDLNFRLFTGNNVEKFLSLQRSLFPTTPWRFLKRCSFLITKGNVVRFQQQTEALFVWYVIVSYSRTCRKLEKLLLGFYQYHEDFDHTEIDRMLGIEICLNNDSKSVVRV